MKNELIKSIDGLKTAVKKENIEAIIESMADLGIDERKSHLPIMEFIHKLLVEELTYYVSKKGTWKVNRKGEYGTPTTDTYRVENGILKRNGTDVRWTSLGKLYQAYKQIKRN